MSSDKRQIPMGRKERGKHPRSLKRDMKRQALKPGRHVSKKGKVYYERRENRTDRGKQI